MSTPATILLLLTATLAPSLRASAQWKIQDSHTTASLRGIHSLGAGVAWASGTNGTVLRTTDDGATWQACTKPPEAEQLDLRGIHAFDRNTAIVMSSGKGNLSRLYKTTDACKTWRLVLSNPDKDGFWDAIRFDSASVTKADYPPHNPCFGVLLGDPVHRQFVILLTYDCGEHWERQLGRSGDIPQGESIFAASNSSLTLNGLIDRIFVTGGPTGPHIYTFWVAPNDTNTPGPLYVLNGAGSLHHTPRGWQVDPLPIHKTGESAGAFSIAHDTPDSQHQQTVIVGGNYKLPDDPQDTAWFLGDHQKWQPSETPPHGYRSSVAYDSASKAWITVGPNGTDISTDAGHNWKPLTPTASDPPDADKNWNALSLPFVVGPNGRIGKLHPTPSP
ncbi:hypothetical protein [Granulicella sp. dw_53]|uniref:WD40/YVTN/BNR-like repeat-containing protein n=1 Tax=Granulicella sp. dw_53 TaxID=2719792 RepID=UPI001BD3D490|nr:hypothetical protein [Granulicella sp. dw_53]